MFEDYNFKKAEKANNFHLGFDENFDEIHNKFIKVFLSEIKSNKLLEKKSDMMLIFLTSLKKIDSKDAEKIIMYYAFRGLDLILDKFFEDTYCEFIKFLNKKGEEDEKFDVLQ